MLSDSKGLNHLAEQPVPAFEYPPPMVPDNEAKSPPGESAGSTLEHLAMPDAKQPAPLAISEDQIRTREAQARKQGRDEGLSQASADFEKKLAGEKQSLANAIREFARERQTYFQRVEAEVVALALAVVRKILHREAQVDPLLLAGVVRVAIDKISAGTHVRLRVHPSQVMGWQHFFSQQHDMQLIPELVGNPALEPGHCLLETELGCTDLTLETQLREIEQGFFDLLSQRPQK